MFELGNKSIEQHRLIGQKCVDLEIDVVLTIGIHSEHTNLALNESTKNKHYHSPDKLINYLKKNIVVPYLRKTKEEDISFLYKFSNVDLTFLTNTM